MTYDRTKVLKARRSERHRMVREQIRKRGIRDRRVQAIMAWVPRECFISDTCASRAYEDSPLPIPCSQTISQPYIVGLMTENLKLNRSSRVLEIGAGSGYQTAILAKIAQHVWAIERVADLVPTAHKRLEKLGLGNVTLIVGDGAEGHPSEAPYDAIVVAAAAAVIPPALVRQLAIGGRLVIPIGGNESQILTLVHKTNTGCRTHSLGECRFVPFVTNLI